MSIRKNQNSFLVLATVGVYLGLVLVGAAPQVLAQAAMTREFCVKDEIEVKDDLDTKPDPKESAASVRSEGQDQNIARSVERFLAHFQPSTGNPALLEPPASSFDFAVERPTAVHKLLSVVNRTFLPVNSIVTLSNFPRADLDHFSAI